MLTAVLLALIPAALVSLFLAIAFREKILRALPFLVALNGVAVPVGGLSVRLDQLAGILLFGALIAAVALGHRRLVTDRTTIYIGAVAAVNVVASVLHSPALLYSIGQVLNQLSVWVIYLVVLNYLDSLDELARFTRLFLIAGLIEAAVGICAFLLGALGVPAGGANVDPNDFGLAFGAYGTTVEPNLFGSYCQIFFLAGMGLIWLSRTRGERPSRFLVAVTGVTGLGLFLSFTRGAWLGTAFGLVVLLVLGWRWLGVRVQPAQIIVPIVATVAIGVALWFAPFGIGEFFRYKVANLVNPESQSASVRLVAYGLALQHIVEHPWIGSGTYSFAALVARGADFREFEGWRNLWIGNYVLLALHDTGIIGLGILVALIASFLRHAARAARRWVAADTARARVQIALIAAFASLLVSFLTSSGLTLGYPWLLMGIIGAYTRLAPEESRAVVRRTMPELEYEH
jgi:O-antigen ligase